MYWENVDSRWVSQYLPSERTYIGSADDGGADPQIGHAAYDYESCRRFAMSESVERHPSLDVLALQANHEPLSFATAS